LATAAHRRGARREVTATLNVTATAPPRLRGPNAAIPEHDGAARVLTVRDRSLESAVVDRMVFDFDGELAALRVQARPFRRPGCASTAIRAARIDREHARPSALPRRPLPMRDVWNRSTCHAWVAHAPLSYALGPTCHFRSPRKHLSELGAEQDDQRRVIDPDE
jgi:hypothetical protein